MQNNSSPEMIKQDPQELNKMKEALGDIDKSVDPTVGAGMNIDDVVNKLLEEDKKEKEHQAQVSAKPQEAVSSPGNIQNNGEQ